MQQKLHSKGKCVFCEEEFSKTSIVRHLNTHLAQKVMEGKPGLSFHIKIETNPRWGSTLYFLMLWVDGNATLEKVDDLLRLIWLECCGHMSAFRLPRRKQGSWSHSFSPLELSNIPMDDGEIPMDKKVKHLFSKDLILQYDYDFGSTTSLQLTVVEVFEVKADKPLVLLSRNERPEILCETCGKKIATQLCSVCSNEETLFCDACAKKHAKKCKDFADYAAMPVVNSPRMGVCAYDGGVIDKERD